MYIHSYIEKVLGTDKWIVAAFFSDGEMLAEIKQWCYNTFGTPGERWVDDIHWGEIRFNSQEDLVVFALRWS